MAYTNIDDPSAHFQIATYTGNGSTQSIVNDGNSDLQPDWLWIKARSTGTSQMITDSSRGVGNFLYAQLTNAESPSSIDVTSFNSDGFSLSTGSSVNGSGQTFVAWQWKANGGTTSSNTNGSITSTVQTNSDAGFSIGTFTGNGSSGATVGHGLGVKPDMIITKSRNNPSGAAMNWVTGHVGLDNMAGLSAVFLNGGNAKLTGSAYWGNSAPTTSVFTVGDNAAINATGNNMLFYAFASKQGYSKFGKYTGNGNTNGPFIYTGFKPAFLITKRIDAAEYWAVWDSGRDTHNVTRKRLAPNDAQVEADSTFTHVDFLSNGFKPRTATGSRINQNGGSYIYMAFAENPFVTSTGIPTTAR